MSDNLTKEELLIKIQELTELNRSLEKENIKMEIELSHAKQTIARQNEMIGKLLEISNNRSTLKQEITEA